MTTMATSMALATNTTRSKLVKSVASTTTSSHVHQQTRGVSTLMYACQQGDVEKVRRLLRVQPSLINERDRTGKTPLHYCVTSDNLTASQAADLLVMAAPELIDSRDEDGFTPLHLAVIAGNMPLVTFLLANNADVNAVDNEKHTVVHWATVCGEMAALNAVLSAEAPVSTPDVHGGFPLHYAAQMCGGEKDSTLGLQVLHALLSHNGIDVTVEDGDGRQPLLWAASAGSAKAVLALIRAGAMPESCDKDGLTALHCAASRGHTDCIDTLLTLCGVSPDVIDSNGCTALHYAVTLGHADATALLLAHGTDPNRQDRKGRTPGHCGCAKGQFETVKMIGTNGGNLWLKNARGDLPLHEASASGRRDLVRWLLDARPSQVNARNNDGRCPIHLAALNDNVDMCKILLDAGSQINPILRTSKNVFMTPLDCALQRGFRSSAKFLQLHGGLPATRMTSPHGQSINLQLLEETTDEDISEKVTSVNLKSQRQRDLSNGNLKNKKKSRRKYTYKNEITITTKRQIGSDDVDDVDADGIPNVATIAIDSERQKSEPVEKSKLETEQKRYIMTKNEVVDTSGDESEQKLNLIVQASVHAPAVIETPRTDDEVKSKMPKSEALQEDLQKVIDLSKEELKYFVETEKEAILKMIAEAETKLTQNARKSVSPPPDESITESQQQIHDERKKSSSSRKGSVTKADAIDRKPIQVEVKPSIPTEKGDNLVNESSAIVSKSEEPKKNEEDELRKVTLPTKAAAVPADSETKLPAENLPEDEETKFDVTEPEQTNVTEEKSETNANKRKADTTQNESVIMESATNESVQNEQISVANQPDINENQSEMNEKQSQIDAIQAEPSVKLESDTQPEIIHHVDEATIDTEFPDASEAFETKPVLEREQAKVSHTVDQQNASEEPLPAAPTKIETLTSIPDDTLSKFVDASLNTDANVEETGTVNVTIRTDSKQAEDVVLNNQKQKSVTINTNSIVQEQKNEEMIKTKAKSIKKTTKNDRKESERERGKRREKINESSDVTPSDISVKQTETKKQTKRAKVKRKDVRERTKPNEKSSKLNDVKRKNDLERENDLERKNGVERKSDMERGFAILETSNTSRSRIIDRRSNGYNDNKRTTFEKSREKRQEMTNITKRQVQQLDSSLTDTEMTSETESYPKGHKSFTILEEDSRVPSLPNLIKTNKNEKERSVSNMSAPLVVRDYYSDSDVDDEEGVQRKDGGGRPSTRRRLKKRRTRETKSAGSDYDIIDSGFEPSPRSSRIPKWQHVSDRGVNMTSVTQTIQTNIRRYHLERKIFQQLLELKRLQIRSGQHNEAVLVKRAIDTYHRSCAATVGAGKYEPKDFTFKSFEHFLYGSLRKLQRTEANHLRGLPETSLNPLLCTQSTHRCYHATHAYTGIPCAAYLPKMDHHTIPKIGFDCKPSGFLPSINSQKKSVTLELCHGPDKQIISLPTERLDQNKRYYVTFTVKGEVDNIDDDSSNNQIVENGHKHATSD